MGCLLKGQESGVVWSNQPNAREWWMWASKARASQRLTSGKCTDLLRLEDSGHGLGVQTDRTGIAGGNQRELDPAAAETPAPGSCHSFFESLGHEDFQAFSLKRSNGPGAAKKVIGNIDSGTHIDVVCVNLRGWQD